MIWGDPNVELKQRNKRESTVLHERSPWIRCPYGYVLWVKTQDTFGQNPMLPSSCSLFKGLFGVRLVAGISDPAPTAPAQELRLKWLASPRSIIFNLAQSSRVGIPLRHPVCWTKESLEEALLKIGKAPEKRNQALQVVLMYLDHSRTTSSSGCVPPFL